MDIDLELLQNTYYLRREDEFPRWRRAHEDRDQILAAPEFTIAWRGPRAVTRAIVDRHLAEGLRNVIEHTLDQARDIICHPQLLMSHRDIDVVDDYPHVAATVAWSRDDSLAVVLAGNLRGRSAFGTYSVSIVEHGDWRWEPESWEDREHRLREDRERDECMTRGRERFSMHATTLGVPSR